MNYGERKDFMYLLKVVVFYFLFLFFMPELDGYEKAITYHSASRTGDQIVDYIHAKWMSYKYGLPLYYRPFYYSSEFVFHFEEQILTSDVIQRYRCVDLNSVQQLNEKVNEDTLYYVHHCPDSKYECINLNWGTPFIDVDWDDETFKKEMIRLIAPVKPLKLIHPPEGIVSIALHYRSGEGFDGDGAKKTRPLIFVSDTYYFNQLKLVQKLTNSSPLYVFIFTDHTDPQKIVHKFRDHFPGDKIIFDCRESSNYNLNVLEDMFSFLNFDCIIRTLSHFSAVASHLGNFKIDISPAVIINDDQYQVNLITRSVWNKYLGKWLPTRKEVSLMKN